MNYTKTLKTVIFEIPLSSYFGKTTRPVYVNGKRDGYKDHWLNSVQDYEESLFEYQEIAGDWSYYAPTIEEIAQAKEYLMKDKDAFTAQELDLFKDTLENDIQRAKVDAFETSYRDEWLVKLWRQTMEQVYQDLKDNLGYNNIPYKLLDDLTDKDFRSNRTDQDHLRLEISKEEIKKALRANYKDEKYADLPDYVDYFNDYFLDYSIKETDTEYIDYYGTLGDTSDWLDCFKDYEETTGKILEYRKDEASKLNNQERASLELKKPLEEIANYIDNYISIEPAKTKIKRQITALKNVIKNAV